MSRLLIVEDEYKIANSLKQGFEENGFIVDVAYQGTNGHDLFFKNKYQLVILDINIPEINGIDLCKIFRDSNATIPILILTALNTIENKTEGYEVGADDYIVKPFEFKELLLKVKAILKRTTNTVDAIPTKHIFADLEMNLYTKEVKRMGINILLTAKEFQLLEYFLRNSNRVISRMELAEKVWNIDFDTQTNVIDVYVNYLRKKIDKNFSNKLIHTQIGMGYIFKIDMNENQV